MLTEAGPPLRWPICLRWPVVSGGPSRRSDADLSTGDGSFSTGGARPARTERPHVVRSHPTRVAPGSPTHPVRPPGHTPPAHTGCAHTRLVTSVGSRAGPPPECRRQPGTLRGKLVGRAAGVPLPLPTGTTPHRVAVRCPYLRCRACSPPRCVGEQAKWTCRRACRRRRTRPKASNPCRRVRLPTGTAHRQGSVAVPPFRPTVRHAAFDGCPAATCTVSRCHPCRCMAAAHVAVHRPARRLGWVPRCHGRGAPLSPPPLRGRRSCMAAAASLPLPVRGPPLVHGRRCFGSPPRHPGRVRRSLCIAATTPSLAGTPRPQPTTAAATMAAATVSPPPPQPPTTPTPTPPASPPPPPSRPDSAPPPPRARRHLRGCRRRTAPCSAPRLGCLRRSSACSVIGVMCGLVRSILIVSIANELFV